VQNAALVEVQERNGVNGQRGLRKRAAVEIQFYLQIYFYF
jgi:hypothetical protein